MKRIQKWVLKGNFLGLYAYATESGARAFDQSMGANFWKSTPSRWLFGIDYGRTQPKAIRYISEKPNTQVRIYDGPVVVCSDGFAPKRDFHVKMSIFLNPNCTRFGMVVGSGNFSSNGLHKSVEAGATLQIHDKKVYRESMKETVDIAEQMWECATLASDILTTYEEKWKPSFAKGVPGNEMKGNIPSKQYNLFWIEAGYVTQNRGPGRPGNQVDLPRGMHRYFGFSSYENMKRNSVIGNIKFMCPNGELVQKNLRLGNNMMEKITLPIPETHGLDIYDGKILVFQRSGGCFIIHALEVEEFDAAFGHRLAAIRIMGGGRRYGHID